DLCVRADGIFVMEPVQIRTLMKDHGRELATKTYLFADPFSTPLSFGDREYKVNDPSWDKRSAAVLTREHAWFRERVRQVHEALHQRWPRKLVPASAYLEVLEAV